jgi:hypothetical protein
VSMTENEIETETGEVVESSARALRKELFTDEMVDELLARVGEDGLSLTGEGGFLPEMIKAVLERGMAGRADRSPRLRQARPGRARGAGTPAMARPRRRS